MKDPETLSSASEDSRAQESLYARYTTQARITKLLKKAFDDFRAMIVDDQSDDLFVDPMKTVARPRE